MSKIHQPQQYLEKSWVVLLLIIQVLTTIMCTNCPGYNLFRKQNNFWWRLLIYDLYSNNQNLHTSVISSKFIFPRLLKLCNIIVTQVVPVFGKVAMKTSSARGLKARPMRRDSSVSVCLSLLKSASILSNVTIIIYYSPQRIEISSKPIANNLSVEKTLATVWTRLWLIISMFIYQSWNSIL